MTSTFAQLPFVSDFSVGSLLVGYAGARIEKQRKTKVVCCKGVAWNVDYVATANTHNFIDFSTAL